MEPDPVEKSTPVVRKRSRVPEGARLAPSPSGAVPLVGHLPALQRDALGFLERTRRECGDIARVNLGPTITHLLAHPDYVRHVLQDKHRNYSKATRAFAKLKMVLGLGLLTSDGTFWLRQRRIAQPAFHRERIESFSSTMVLAAELMTSEWDAHAASGTPIDVHKEMMQVTLRIVSMTLLGTDVSGHEDEVGKSIAVAQEDIEHRVNSVFDIPLVFPTARNLRFRRAMRTLDRVVLNMIE